MTHYVLDGRTATPHFPGIGRYVGNLARALEPLLADEERLTVLEDPAHPMALGPRVQRVTAATSPFSAGQQVQVPRLLKTLGADVYHSAYLLMPYRPGVPTLLTVYDLIPLLMPEQSSRRAAAFFRTALWLALRAAQRFIVISESTRRDLLARFNLAPDRVAVIRLAADPAFRLQSAEAVNDVRERYVLPERYVLYVGSNKPHKNLESLTTAWEAVAQRPEADGAALVIAGAWDDQYGARPPDDAAARIRWLGRVPERDLPALYGGATLFAFPSLYEGFGLPVLEAMAVGTPVVCSNRSSLPEVVGDAALLVDASDARALGEGIATVLSDARRREQMRQLGLAQAAAFSWQLTARRTLEVYRSVATGNPPNRR